MTESQRTTSEQEKPRNVATTPITGADDGQRSSNSSPVGVYDQTTATGNSSSNLMWIILLIVLVIVAFFVLRQWM